MSDQEKKVEVRFGAFACTIEGYDNPVEQLQEVLGLMQKMIADTPALASSDNSFDPKPIQKALDGDDAPGIVVIRNEDAATRAPDAGAEETVAPAQTDDVVEAAVDLDTDIVLTDGPAWPDATTAETAPDMEETPERMPETAEPVATREDDSSTPPPQEPTGGIGGLTQGMVAAAAAGAAYLGGQAAADTQGPGFRLDAVGSDPAPAEALEEETEPELVSEQLQSGDQFAAAAPVEPDSEPAPLNDVEATTSETAPSLEQAADSFDADLDALEAELDAQFDPLAADPQEQLAEALAEVPAEQAPLSEPAAVPLNIFGAPPAEPESIQQPEADPIAAQDHGVPQQMDPPPFEPEPAVEEPELTQDPEPQAEPEPEPLEAAADPAPEPVNIFGAPRPDPTPEPTPSAPVSPNIFAAPAAAAAALAPAAELIEENASDVLDTGDPVTATEAELQPEYEAPADLDDTIATQQAEVTEPAAPLTSIFAPPPLADKVRDLGSDLSSAMADLTAEPETAEPAFAQDPFAPEEDISIPETTDAVLADGPPEAAEPEVSRLRSIFAPPPEPEPLPEPEPEPPAVEPEEVSPPASNSRFEDLLSRVHGTTTMGAPGETTADEPVQAPPPIGAPNTGLTGIAAAQFAQVSKANTVAEQLAASAAWLTLAKGQSRFTRREVMAVLETIPANEPRELADRIKGFGKLVRSGTLVLIDDGVFAMAQGERERFKAMLP